jgi:hypothetical protein
LSGDEMARLTENAAARRMSRSDLLRTVLADPI